MLPWDLEDWITDVGANALERRLAGHTLSPTDQLVYEIWLLDTEARNGGLSQYFCNHGRSQWESCVAAAKHASLSSFEPFALAVASLISNSSDPYSAIREGGDAAEDLWFHHQSAVVRALREFCQDAP